MQNKHFFNKKLYQIAQFHVCNHRENEKSKWDNQGSLFNIIEWVNRGCL